MKTKSLLLILPIILVACAHLPHTKAITGTLLPVLDRYNAYAQSNLTGDELNRALDASDNIRNIYQLNLEGRTPSDFGGFLGPILDKHDQWVKADQSLDNVHRNTYLNSTKTLRALYDLKEN